MSIQISLPFLVAITACSGAAFGSQPVPADDCYPDAITHPDQIAMEDIAGRMIRLLPQSERAKIQAADGLGSEAIDLSRLSTGVDRSITAHVDPDITPAEYRDMLVSDELEERMTDTQRMMLDRLVEQLTAGIQPPALCFTPGTDPDYVNAINQLLEFRFQIMFQQTGRWSSTAVDGGGLGQGDPTTITYSYVPDGTFVPDLIGPQGNSNLFSWLNGIYGSPDEWQPIFDQVFDRWAELTGTSYIYEPNDDGANLNGPSGVVGVRGDVRIAAITIDGNSGVLAYNNFPNDGDMVFDSADNFYNFTGGNSLRLRNVAAHEHGHGLGMLHVCPIQETKLMEPFVTTDFDGPQLDDILNGIRHYGDVYEPDNSIAQANDLGTLGIGGIATVENAGVDDNSDSDYFKVSVNQRSRITFSVSPDAAAYVQGGQTSQCNGGSLTDYNSVHNLQITVVDSDGIFLDSINETGFGESETMVFDAETPGDYFFIVNGATNVNSVQRYEALVLVTNVPFLVPVIEADPPEAVDPGVPGSFDVTIDPREDTIVPGSAELFVSINGDAFAATPLASNGGESYTATLPPANCDDTVEFYIAVEGETGGEITLPEDGASDPFSASVGEFISAFEDDFETDMGWSVSGDALGRATGRWERGVPAGDGSRGDAPNDADGSGSCYLTGNGGPGSNTDVDDGETILTSPAFDVSGAGQATVSYSRWYDNTGSGTGAAPGADIFTVQISDNNGANWTNLEIVGPNTAESSGGWFSASFQVGDFVSLTDEIRIRFIAEDAGDGSVIEAAVDAIKVEALTCEAPDICLADFNNDGSVNFFDISAFLTAFNGGDQAADVTGDGVLNFFDVSSFLGAFSAGCP
ncbi:MAG: GC-type dockerin domain-anchored protein [Phycisphaerales bacterium]